MGNSIFDNAAYTDGGPDVVTQLNDLLPAGWATSLLAVNGSTTDDIAGQVGSLPSDASHLVLSVGGNDALQQAHLLFAPASSTEEAVGLAGRPGRAVRSATTTRAVAACLRPALPLHRLHHLQRQLPRPRLPAPGHDRAGPLQRRHPAHRHRPPPAGDRSARAICTYPEDYANPIEPSSVGGEKIARAIAALATHGAPTDRATRILTGA
ncbi:MAG: SGNH/GDSL hydrolase family protein [Anaerolineae bacterium]